MMDLFKRRAQVMIATEAGGEGINLQFCSNVINYDLPWNPMRVEQRIGRVHRLGQTRDVQIYNLSTRGTIEEYILHLLHEKINMFEMVIGSLDTILERWTAKGKAPSVESSLAKIMLESKSDAEIRSRLDQIGQEFHQYKQELEHDPLHT
jgi:SNF2 family DNA or RNA helicase